ncbi:MAG TPA: TetR/AcrR family transcriptional regulator [Hyphomicrobiales bacterium]|nr:TetR/AcrR family transcriptional regulator [Hyphomicrobiales bacterium]
MPKLAPRKQHERREHFLDCAERCFIEKGFRTTTMDDICREAASSTGALYGYFRSKEELVCGLCERESARFGKQLSEVAEAPDFLAALRTMAERFCEEPIGKVRLHVEIAAEASRNEAVSKTMREMDKVFSNSFIKLLERERDCGRVQPKLAIPAVVQAISVLGKGLFSRRALYPEPSAAAFVPAIMAMVSALLVPTSSAYPPEF